MMCILMACLSTDAKAKTRRRRPDRKNEINLIPSRYHWDQLDAKVIVLDINFPVRE
jgi:hypothetical protein